MKLHNPFAVAVEFNSLFLVVSLWILSFVFLAMFVATVLVYPVFTLPILGAIVTGRVVYAIIKGK